MSFGTDQTTLGPISGYVGARFETTTQTRGLSNIQMIAYDTNGRVVDDASWAPFDEG